MNDSPQTAPHAEKIPCPCESHPALRVVPLPADLNPAGDVFGGWIMSMVDIAGSVAARRRARSRVATVAVNSFVFKQPVSVGDLVSFYAEVVSTGNTSVTVDVVVYVERNPENAVALKVTEARLTYVALDHHGNKRPIPPEE
ncbi:MAG: acyl-CoA thioesterase [Betaproteobacteria bacterium]|nr:acyl-CoA thioesterase [Betaproteobacteria bacterium]